MNMNTISYMQGFSGVGTMFLYLFHSLL